MVKDCLVEKCLEKSWLENPSGIQIVCIVKRLTSRIQDTKINDTQMFSVILDAKIYQKTIATKTPEPEK